MELARVIGTVWATRKEETLTCGRILLLQPIDELRRATGSPLAALDTVGAGVGEIVFYVTAYEAVIPWKRRRPGIEMAGVDASVVGIVDGIESGGGGA